MNKVFIGADPRQVVSLTTLTHSIHANAKEPVEVIPLVIENLPLKRQGLTPFTWSRFLVPHLSNYEGRSLFLDADMLTLGDINEVFDIGRQQSTKAVCVMQDQPLFEWASMILFNNAHPANKKLTPEYIETTTDGLHKIGWLEKDDIGKLPLDWNVCVPYSIEGQHANGAGMRQAPANAKLVHFTTGVPHWWETADQPYANAWLNHRDAAGARGGDITATHRWPQLMGRSVHFEPVLKRLIASGKVNSPSEYVSRILDECGPGAERVAFLRECFGFQEVDAVRIVAQAGEAMKRVAA